MAIMMKKRFIYLACLLACSLTAISASAKDWKVIRFGVAPDYPPFESKAPDGQLQGFDIDLGHALCAKLNAQCEWIEQDFDSLIIALKARKFDAVLSSLAVTDQRKKQIDFSDQILEAPMRLLARVGATFDITSDALKGKHIGVQRGSIQESYAKLHWVPKGVIVRAYQSQDQVYADLLSGRLEAALVDQLQAQIGFLKTPRGKKFAFIGSRIIDPKSQGFAIGFRKQDTDLKSQINQALAALRQEGSFQKLAKKYFDAH
jgi:histidine transport system substrate-binding protein